MNKFQFCAVAAAALAATVSGAAPVASSPVTSLPSVPVSVTNSPQVTVANPVTIANPVAVSGTVNAAISSVVSVQSAFPRTPVMIPLTSNNGLDPTGSLYTVPAGQYLVIETISVTFGCKGDTGGTTGGARLLLMTGASSGTQSVTGIPLLASPTPATIPMRIVLTTGTQVLLLGGTEGCSGSGGFANLFGYQMSASSPSLEP